MEGRSHVRTVPTKGVQFSYGGFVGNTFDSHRLICLVKARQEGGSQLQDFSAHFEMNKAWVRLQC
jgi:hypothetical protein